MRAVGFFGIVFGLIQLVVGFTYPHTLGRTGATATASDFVSAHADFWTAREEARLGAVRVTGEDPRSGESAAIVGEAAIKQFASASGPVAARLIVGGILTIVLGVGVLAKCATTGRLLSFRWMGDLRWVAPAAVLLVAYLYATMNFDMKGTPIVAWLGVTRAVAEHWQTWWDMPAFDDRANRELASIVMGMPSDIDNSMFSEARGRLYRRVWTAGTLVTSVNWAVYLTLLLALWRALARRKQRSELTTIDSV